MSRDKRPAEHPIRVGTRPCPPVPSKPPLLKWWRVGKVRHPVNSPHKRVISNANGSIIDLVANAGAEAFSNVTPMRPR